MLKIRLSRIGTKKKPFYRVVAVDERAKRTGAYIELLGTYNPLTEPKDIKLKKDRIDYWIKQGAQPSTGYLRIIGKAPQRPPRKPKKASKQGTVNSEQVVKQEKTEEAPIQEEPKVEEAKPKESEKTDEGAA
ncbi:30S ribosomal protein S16 [Candidatus Daviesbacteria bacterium RIFCSPLOWO2_02_FULL_36_7]|uniref:Small ribosomal subunit protein bS16 n=1 Tax=Candidatus Daviesbacteria bacterium RIFCSPLOWO2_02_FULL_36_7 TaxID=1797792 RepID=A0A1F5MG63_9BACT|nr:MAG: 30S ribosomal protein S16 [Candidatus Daviesbacteria bacterium RIFCSPLOWO2_02_FULL_36_7]